MVSWTWFYMPRYPLTSPSDRSKRFTLHPLTGDTNSNYLGTIQPCWRLYTHISTELARYSFGTARWTWASRRERKCPSFATKGIRTRALSIESLTFFRWATVHGLALLSANCQTTLPSRASYVQLFLHSTGQYHCPVVDAPLDTTWVHLPPGHTRQAWVVETSMASQWSF